MDGKTSELVFIGFLLPVIFAIALVAEGTYRMVRQENRREEGAFNMILGSVLLFTLSLFYILFFKR